MPRVITFKFYGKKQTSAQPFTVLILNTDCINHNVSEKTAIPDWLTMCNNDLCRPQITN